MLTACSESDEDSAASDRVRAALAFSVTDQPLGLATTRMDNTVVQGEEQSFRGMSVEQIIPFTTTTAVTASDVPVDMILTGQSNPKQTFFYYSDCTFTPGTASMLVYGKATPKTTGLPSGVTEDMYNGTLTPTFPTDLSPAGIQFRMVPIVTDVPTEAGQIATYLSNIANTIGWSETGNNLFYNDFVGKKDDGSYSVLAGSSASVKAYVNALKTKLEGLGVDIEEDWKSIRTAIYTEIGDLTTEFNTNYGGYPANQNLPDGAAMLKWNNTESKFEVQTKTSDSSPINSLTGFVYPPDLWYFANSRIRTKDQAVSESVYSGANDWPTVLGNYSADNAAVSHYTQAVAITDAIQYAVARMEIQLANMTGTLQDNSTPSVSITASNEKFPLTGIIIGGQRTMAFDFKPKEPLSDEDLHYIYDSYPNPAEDEITHTRTVNTLVLQTYDNETVKFVLEFENNSGEDFKGVNGGIVYRDTKFYLAGSVDPTTLTGGEDYNRRVFTRDCKTVLKMKVGALKSAYNVMPDLQSPRLELGVVLTGVWTESQDNHEIYNW